jgi:hypothetical protein
MCCLLYTVYVFVLKHIAQITILTFKKRTVSSERFVHFRLDFRPDRLELEKFWDVEADGEGQDRDDVVANGPGLGQVVERVADGEVSKKNLRKQENVSFRDDKIGMHFYST